MANNVQISFNLNKTKDSDLEKYLNRIVNNKRSWVIVQLLKAGLESDKREFIETYLQMDGSLLDEKDIVEQPSKVETKVEKVDNPVHPIKRDTSSKQKQDKDIKKTIVVEDDSDEEVTLNGVI
jgi:hypothetical protein